MKISKKSNQKKHYHIWREMKTYFTGSGDKYILSRFCKTCGVQETYSGLEKRWVKLENIPV